MCEERLNKIAVLARYVYRKLRRPSAFCVCQFRRFLAAYASLYSWLLLMKGRSGSAVASK
jgi:hypothetical protein